MTEKRNIRVLNIITLFSVGGATETVVSMASGLREKGYDVHIATGPPIPTEGSMYEAAAKLGIPVFTFRNLKRAIRPLSDFLIIVQLAWFIRRNRYDIVHTHSSKAGVVGRIAAWLARTPVRIHTIHGLPFHRYQPWYLRNCFKLIEKITAATCHRIVAVTHTIITEMERDNLVPRSKCVMIRSGFDISGYVGFDGETCSLRKKYGLGADDIVLGKVSRFSILKGHTYLLTAFTEVCKRVPNAKLLLIGNGELENELKQSIVSQGLSDRVIFTGLVPPRDIPSVISLLDILVHTSLLEGLARVLPQAIMMGKPVISFDLDGAHEVVYDGINGYLIEPENTGMLA